jgi:hypothetical protein
MKKLLMAVILAGMITMVGCGKNPAGPSFDDIIPDFNLATVEYNLLMNHLLIR